MEARLIKLFGILCLGMLFLFFPTMSSFMADSPSYDFIELTDKDIQWMKMFKFMHQSGYYKDFFLFSDTKIPTSTLVDKIGEKLALIAALAFGWRHLEVKFLIAILAVDFIDLLLTYNETWFTFNDFEITWNILSVLIFGFFMVYRLCMPLFRKSAKSLD